MNNTSFPGTGSPKWNAAIIGVMSCTCAFLALTSQNVSGEKDLFQRRILRMISNRQAPSAPLFEENIHTYFGSWCIWAAESKTLNLTEMVDRAASKQGQYQTILKVLESHAMRTHYLGGAVAQVEPASCNRKVASSIPHVCMSKCPWARYWTPNCSWCAGRHLAYPHQCMNVWITVSRFVQKHLLNALKCKCNT